MHEDPFARTLHDLEDTLTASHIAIFPVWCCLPSDDVTELKRRISSEELDYSFVPVRNDVGKITGVVHRDRLVGKSGTVNAHQAALAPGQVVEARSSLKSTIEALEDRRFLLVYSPESGQPDGIGGIITRADVQKTPVRLSLFAQLIELETRLRRGLADTKWELRDECKKDRSDAEKQKKRYKGDTLDALENYLGIGRLLHVTRRVGMKLLPELNDAEFASRVEHVRKARNQVCHGLDVRGDRGSLATPASLREAFRIIENTMEAVSRLEHRQP